MLTFTLRRLLTAIPTLLLISLVIFLLVDFAPGSPMSDIPLTVPPEVRQKMMAALGADQRHASKGAARGKSRCVDDVIQSVKVLGLRACARRQRPAGCRQVADTRVPS